ncbi:MAG: tyrosine-type recombinase/integrase [Gammaproteobacteria bacterium]|jgi:integrase|nr:tyrosine-type recombinase/integrase [Gammaproteobacteria bacterium]
MATTETQSLEPKRIRKNKPKIRTAEHPLYDGEAILFRTPPSGNVWQFQMWIKEEQEYLRRSTRSKDLNEAIRVGRDLYLDTHSKLRSSEAVFPKSMREIADKFLEQKQTEVGINKSQGRWVTIRSQVKHLLVFIGEKTKITDIPQNKWESYYQFRRTSHPSVINATLKNETNTIRSFFRFAISRNFISYTKLPEFQSLPKESRKRQAFDVDEWKSIYTFMRSNQWMKNESSKVEEQRFFIRQFALILVNTGVRFGEARKLQWRNIKITQEKSSEENTERVVKISLDAEQTKNNKARIVIGRRGDVFDRLKKYSNYTKPNDFVFVDNDTGEQIVRDSYYKHWNYLINATNLNENRQESTFYCLRHTYATWRLYAHTDVFLLARNMGTSVKYIEDHYGQTKQELMVGHLTKLFDKDEAGQFLFD